MIGNPFTSAEIVNPEFLADETNIKTGSFCLQTVKTRFPDGHIKAIESFFHFQCFLSQKQSYSGDFLPVHAKRIMWVKLISIKSKMEVLLQALS